MRLEAVSLPMLQALEHWSDLVLAPSLCFTSLNVTNALDQFSLSWTGIWT